jgi:transcriptional regulator with XRE-family HTH domain
VKFYLVLCELLLDSRKKIKYNHFLSQNRYTMYTVISLKMVANNVRAWREHLGMKQHVVADELGVRREWYVKLENGQVGFKVEQVLIIAHLFQISPEAFFKEKPEFGQQKNAPPKIEHNLDQMIEEKVISLFAKLMRSVEFQEGAGK